MFKRKGLMPRMTEWEARLTVCGRRWFHRRIVPRNKSALTEASVRAQDERLGKLSYSL